MNKTKHLYTRKNCVIVKNNKLAIKIIPYDPNSVEYAIHKELHHPNIVKLYNHKLIDWKEYLYMEYIDGMTLENYILLQTSFILNLEYINIFDQILKAVAYLHKMKINHNDLKLENIMITKDKTIKLLDFGSAVIHQNFDGFEFKKVGSLLYMPPEMRAKSQYYYGKNDIWALGIILYECITGVYPFATEDGKVNFNKSIDYTGINEDIKTLIECLLMGNPNMRPLIWVVVNMFDDIKLISSIHEYTEEEYAEIQETNIIDLFDTLKITNDELLDD